jgi:hypothetical protein
MSLPVPSPWSRTASVGSIFTKLYLGLFAVVLLMRLIDRLAN